MVDDTSLENPAGCFALFAQVRLTHHRGICATMATSRFSQSSAMRKSLFYTQSRYQIHGRFETLLKRKRSAVPSTHRWLHVTPPVSSLPNGTKLPVFQALGTKMDELIQQSLWLIPRKGTGFDNFFPKNKRNEDPEKDTNVEKNGGAQEEKGSEKAGKSEGSKEKDARFNSSGGGGGGGDPGGSPPPPPNFTSTMLTGMAMIFLTYMLTKAEETGATPADFAAREISWGDFCNHLLEQDQVEKIVVTSNRSVAKVFLKPGSLGLPQHQQNRQVRYADRRQQAVNDDETRFGSSSASDGFGSSGDTFDSHGKNPNQRPVVYRFAIGSVDAFEKKLEEAQRAIGKDPSQDIPVQYAAESSVASEIMSVVPSLLLMGAAFYFMRFAAGSMMGGSSGNNRGGFGGMFQIGKSTAKKIAKEDVKVDFSNVAGCDEAKREIMEFVDFLKEPDQFTKLGAKIPKGALLCGPPGTGKTLLAKAVAGEAGVPFFTISGSDFIEMFVGVGPSRVRDLFKEARTSAPCIIFIDEIDAVGRQRGRGGMGGNDERENTLNQLLVEMDGFNPTTGVVVLAGTNRVDILDQALTRPGRFDRQIIVDKPDLKGRKAIFKVHLEGITLEDDPDDVAGRLAGLTPGFAGADIANICNEAAIVAARRKAETVSMDDFEKATDRIIGGLESNKIISKEERDIVAHHEAGHAVAGWFLEHADPLLKVTIIPRSSGALGFAQYLPKEVFLRTQDQIMDIVCMALAGRAAEEIFFGRVTTGASDDLRRVTDLVYSTIQVYGMNPRLGQLAFPKDPNAMFDERPYSEKTAKAMDEEAKRIVDEAYHRTLNLLKEHKDEVEKIANMLMDKETITHDDVYETIGPRPFKGNPQYDEFVRRFKEAKDSMKPDDSDSHSETSTEETTPPSSQNESGQPGLAFSDNTKMW
eukprot:Nitzschia sp. Nitz4//scaffold31_size150131//97815//100746//NITZ4_002841-RA/size150131-augustus-gene-0.6-mRNA-1//1//CDS//3329547698//7562//frame0